MDEAKKRAFREAALGRLVIKRVGLPVTPFKAREYSIEHGQFEALFQNEKGERKKIDRFDKALVSAVDEQAIERERTYADVGREVCALIEMARGWTPMKPTKSVINKAANDIEKAAKILTNKIKEFERLHGWVEPYRGKPSNSPTSPWFESQIGIPHEEMLSFLETLVSVNVPEIRSQANGNDPKQADILVGNKQLIGKIWAEAFKGLFGQEAGEGASYNLVLDEYSGPFIRFGRIIASYARLAGISDKMLYRYPNLVKKAPQSQDLETGVETDGCV